MVKGVVCFDPLLYLYVIMPVEIAIQLPDEFAAKLREQSDDLSELGLEKLVCSM
jgi:hypothetical protein